MQRSVDRVLTTHTGSLPRAEDVEDMLIARQQGRQLDDAKFGDRIRTATEETVAKQAAAGVDVISDGETAKADFVDYICARLEGFSGETPATEAFYFGDVVELPDIVAAVWGGTHFKLPECTGDITYTGKRQVEHDVANYKAALEGKSVTEAFMPAASPGLAAMFLRNKYYKNYENYIHALAAAMNTEYRTIVDAGLSLQLDCPDISFCADFHTWMYSEVETRSVRKLQDLHVEALNAALEGIPAESVRIHLCWGNYQGPHTHDMPIRDALEPAFNADVAGVNFEAANPAHAHEWEEFETLKVPDDKIIIPGIIDTKSQVVENPRLVAQRIVQYAHLVGQERVIAGTDCGFGTAVGAQQVHPKITWMKLNSLVEGAAAASKELKGAK